MLFLMSTYRAQTIDRESPFIDSLQAYTLRSYFPFPPFLSRPPRRRDEEPIIYLLIRVAQIYPGEIFTWDAFRLRPKESRTGA